MDLRINLADTLENCEIVTYIKDMDNEDKAARVVITISGHGTLNKTVQNITNKPKKISWSNTPRTGKNHTITAEIFPGNSGNVSDSDSKMIKLCS